VDTNAHLKAQTVGDRWYVLVAYTTISERGQYVVMLPATTPLRELGHRTVARERKPLRAGAPVQYFVEDFRVFRGVFFGVAPADDHLWLVRRNLATEAAETQRVADLGPVGSAGTERRGAIELVGSRLYVGTSSGLQGMSSTHSPAHPRDQTSRCRHGGLDHDAGRGDGRADYLR
jgi:hypothetical protein